MNNAAIVTSQMLACLPEPVHRYFEFSGVLGKPIVRTVIVRQTGRIRTGPEKPWMRFRATESYSLDPPSFVWKAVAGYGPLPLLIVRDSYIEGKGGVQVKLAGLLPMVNARGPQCDYSSAVRFLSEVVWFPSAFLLPTSIDDKSAEVSFTAFARPAPAVSASPRTADPPTLYPGATKIFVILSRCFGPCRPPPTNNSAVLPYQVEVRQCGIWNRQISHTSVSRLRRSLMTRATHDRQVPQNR
jgi:hypothetical protein